MVNKPKKLENQSISDCCIDYLVNTLKVSVKSDEKLENKLEKRFLYK